MVKNLGASTLMLEPTDIFINSKGAGHFVCSTILVQLQAHLGECSVPVCPNLRPNDSQNGLNSSIGIVMAKVKRNRVRPGSTPGLNGSSLPLRSNSASGMAPWYAGLQVNKGQSRHLRDLSSPPRVYLIGPS